MIPIPFDQETVTKILSYEVAKLGAAGIEPSFELASKIGKVIGVDISDDPAVIRAAQTGAARGAVWAARRLPTRLFDTTETFSAHPYDVTDALDEQFGKAELIPGKPSAGASRIYGKVVMSGIGNMNPALVIALQTQPDTSPIIQFSGHAKEGLFNQQTAKKAVKRCIDDLYGVLRDPNSQS